MGQSILANISISDDDRHQLVKQYGGAELDWLIGKIGISGE
tara:strand:+ start:458 stop:580 length:123 start_codon:yes stop_codon:yes gene_type:complete